MNFIDSHAHLADPVFDADRLEVTGRSRQSGARAVICIGESMQAADRARELARAEPTFLFWTAGIHPYDALSFDSVRDVEAIRARLELGAVAVGECGLDYHYDHSPPLNQRRAFAAQLALAGEHQKPVVVHTREAEADTRAMVSEAGSAGVRGVLHCYTGSVDLAEAALEHGWYVSFSGIITFKKWSDDDLLRCIPATRLLVESDSPYLAPVPHRGHRNEPAWVTFTVARLAAARSVDPAKLAEETSENARRLFGLAMDAPG